jgi:hypothetical protein
LEVKHGEKLALTIIIVKDISWVFRPNLQGRCGGEYGAACVAFCANKNKNAALKGAATRAKA